MPIIDIHIHIQPLAQFRPDALELIKRGRRDYDEVLKYSESPKEFLKFLDTAGIERAGLINYVSPDVIGFGPEVNDWIAQYCSAEPRRLLAFGSVHPKYVPDAGAEVERLKKLGIRGLKVHPSHQLFAPNDYRNGFGPLRAMYEKAEALGMPVMIHTGTSIFPGARNLYAQPMLADDLGVDFPNLVVILAHGGRPLWMEEAFFLVRRHPRMYIDISGIPPQKLMEYFPRIEEIADKVLFGTDWPGPGVPGVRGNIEKFRALPISAATQQKILYDNAARLFPI
ncbi:MAG TPA: amidohydrolase family protein [Candidatus Limnocylindrales bacterium]|nr:amidohydrolase family protein [Candidatus Limnocylindrales bacterium]